MSTWIRSSPRDKLLSVTISINWNVLESYQRLHFVKAIQSSKISFLNQKILWMFRRGSDSGSAPKFHRLCWGFLLFDLNSQHLCVHELLLADVLFLLPFQDAVLFVCDSPRCVLCNLTDRTQSLLIRGDRPHAVQTQLPADLFPHLADLQHHDRHLGVHSVSVFLCHLSQSLLAALELHFNMLAWDILIILKFKYTTRNILVPCVALILLKAIHKLLFSSLNKNWSSNFRHQGVKTTQF